MLMNVFNLQEKNSSLNRVFFLVPLYLSLYPFSLCVHEHKSLPPLESIEPGLFPGRCFLDVHLSVLISLEHASKPQTLSIHLVLTGRSWLWTWHPLPTPSSGWRLSMLSAISLPLGKRARVESGMQQSLRTGAGKVPWGIGGGEHQASFHNSCEL